MKKNNLKIIVGLLAFVLVTFQGVAGALNTAQAVPGETYTVIGRANLDGLPADGATVLLTDTITGATSTDIVGPTGSSQISGWYSFDLNLMNPAVVNGDNITIEVASSSLIGTTSFIYDESLTFFNPDTIDLVTPASQKYTISATAGSGGAISPMGDVEVNSGGDLIFTITPDPGYGVLDVLVNGTSTGAVSSYTFTNVIANQAIDATFAPLSTSTSTIISTTGANGTISPMGTTTVSNGTNQTYLITADNSYAVEDVLVDGVSVGAVSAYTFQDIATNHTISASFVAVPITAFTLTSSAGVNGTISPLGITVAMTGGEQIFAITPDAGYEVADVLVDGTSVGAITTYTLSNIVANHTISASFQVASIPVLTSIIVTPASSSIQIGKVQPFVAVGYDQFDNQIGASFVWSTNNATSTSVNANGLATALEAGTSTITATSGAVSGSAQLVVTPIPVLTSINITPATRLIASGTSYQFTANTVDQFGNQISATPVWSVSNPAVASVIATSGLVTALSVGTSSILATSGDISGSALLMVATSTFSPVINPVPSQSARVNSALSFVVSATNPNNGTIVYSLGTNAPAGTSIDQTSGTFSWTPTTVGTYTFDVLVNDGLVDQVSTSVTIDVRAASSGGGGGGGGPIYNRPPTSVTAINVDLVLLPTQSGRLEQSLMNSIQVNLTVPADAIATKTTFRITNGSLTRDTETEKNDRLQPIYNSFFNITAIDDFGNVVKNFLKPISVKVAGVDLANDVTNLGVYYFNQDNRVWTLISNASYNQTAQTFDFTIDRPALFGIFRVAGLPSIIKPIYNVPEVGGSDILPNGTLMRGSNNIIYVIRFGQKDKIFNLKELWLYRGKVILNVSDEIIANHPDYVYRNGDLLRADDYKIYVIVNNKLHHILNLTELKKYTGKKIYKVNRTTLSLY